MAGKIVIDTKINVDEAKDELKSLEKEYKKLEAEHERASNRLEQQLNIGLNVHDAPKQEVDAMVERLAYLEDRIKSLKSTIADAKASKGTSSATKELDEQGESAKKATSKINKLRNACNRTASAMKKFGKSAKSSGSNINFGVKKMMRMYAVLRALRSMINIIKNALKDGINNLAQFNDGLNPTNKALSSIKSAFTQFKNSIAVALTPLLTVIEPALNRLINTLSNAMNKLGEFFSALSGATVFNKAIKVQEDYAKSLNGTASSAKKAKGALASFDKLNVINKDEGSGSSELNPNQMFETVQIDSKVVGFAEKIRKAFESIGDTFGEIFSKLDWSPFKTMLDKMKSATSKFTEEVDFSGIKDSLSRLAEHCNPLIEKLAGGITFLYENVLLPLASFTIEDFLPSFFDTLSESMETVNTTTDTLSPTLESFWNDILKPIGKILENVILLALEKIRETMNLIESDLSDKNQAARTNNVFVTLIKLISLLLPILEILLNTIINVGGALIKWLVRSFEDIIDICSGLIDFFVGMLTGDLKKMFGGIWDTIRGMVNLIVIDPTQAIIDTIIGLLNGISFDVPDWIPGVGGKHFGLNIPSFEIPRLATGTVVPRQSREFMAILGDNNKETEVVSPLSTMKQAMLEALAESGIANNRQQGDIVVQIDGKEVFRAVKKQNENYIRRTGTSAFTY